MAPSDADIAMKRAARWLASRASTVHEMTERLERAGFEPEVVEHTIERLEQLDLLDDEDFARQWVEQRASSKGSRVLVAELGAKGVDLDTIESVVGEVAQGDEEDRAEALASRHLGRLCHLPIPVQARRLMALLARRGFEAEASVAAVRSVLPLEGWD